MAKKRTRKHFFGKIERKLERMGFSEQVVEEMKHKWKAWRPRKASEFVTIPRGYHFEEGVLVYHGPMEKKELAGEATV